MNLDLEVRSVYGCDKIYPMNLEANLLAEIAGTVTLAPKVIALALLIARLSGGGACVSWTGPETAVHLMQAAVAGNLTRYGGDRAAKPKTCARVGTDRACDRKCLPECGIGAPCRIA